MLRLLPRLALALSLTVAVAAPLAALAPAASAEIAFKAVGPFKLPGDLEVVALENHTQPQVTIDTWLNAGSSRDYVGYPGLAYATALALWEGGKAPLVRQLEGMGAKTSVEVGRDYAHFSATVPSAQAEAALGLIGQALANPPWDGLELPALRNRLATLQLAAADQAPSEQLLRALFGPEVAHAPTGQPETAARLNLDEIKHFYDQFYVPSRTRVMLVGDLDTGKSVGQVVNAYAAFLKREAVTGGTPARPLAAPAVVFKQPAARLAIGARGPAMSDERGQATMAMLAEVLAGNDKARLNQALSGLASQVSARWMAFSGPGALVIEASCPPENAAAVEKAVRDAIGGLRDTTVTLNEHAKAMQSVVTAYDKRNQTLAEQAATMGYFATVAGDYRWARTYPEVVRQISRMDMLEAAQKYLTPEAIKVVVLTP